MNWYIGTVGFGYKQWIGTFYPEGLKSADFLSHYANYFDSAEIDSTFYGTPRHTTVEKWANAVPAHFRFCPKTPRTITHDTPIAQAVAPMIEFVERVGALGDKLGAILIQFPASFQVEQLAALSHFLAQLPVARYAIEFRHPSWEVEEAVAMVRERRCAWVSADYGTTNEHRMAEFIVRPTAEWLYLRFIGWHGAFNTKNAVKIDQTPRLQRWLETLNPVQCAYAYFNNDYSGYSIATANLLKSMLGMPHDEPKIFRQPSLFG
jgi:uncharacterized protein YecE (DUF72 family)